MNFIRPCVESKTAETDKAPAVIKKADAKDKKLEDTMDVDEDDLADAANESMDSSTSNTVDETRFHLLNKGKLF